MGAAVPLCKDDVLLCSVDCGVDVICPESGGGGAIDAFGRTLMSSKLEDFLCSCCISRRAWRVTKGGMDGGYQTELKHNVWLVVDVIHSGAAAQL